MPIYNEEHRIFQRSIRAFCERELLPNLATWERNHDFPNAVFQKLGAEGFLGIRLAEEWGGVDGDYLLAGAWTEEFGRVPSVGLTTAVNMHSLVITPTLARLGSPQAKDRWLRSAVQGQSIGAYAFTEPGAGSDLTAIQTKAVKDGTGYILNGSKIFITNGARANFILVLARTGSTTGYEGFTTFVVDTSLPGFKVHKKLDKLGWHCSDTAEIGFTDVRLDQECILGAEGQGWRQAMQSLEWERLMLTLAAIGGAFECLRSTVQYVNDRQIFGRSVGSFDANREDILNLWSQLEAGRAFAHRCLKMLQQGKRCRLEVSLAKLHICELAIKIADRCLQLHGGYGYTTEFLPERWLRDLRLNTIGGGTTQVMARVATKEVFGSGAAEV